MNHDDDPITNQLLPRAALLSRLLLRRRSAALSRSEAGVLSTLPRRAPRHRARRPRGPRAADDDAARQAPRGARVGRARARPRRRPRVLVSLTDGGRTPRSRTSARPTATVLRDHLVALSDDEIAALLDRDDSAGDAHRRAAAGRRTMTSLTTHTTRGGFFAQPKAVWAVAFAAVVSFMGLGLVDPILPAIATDLHASPSQVELLFTSYFAVTGVSMLVTSAVASRIGAKRTLLAGLAADHRLLRAGRRVEQHRRDRRPARRLGPGQRALHRHRAVGDHRLGQRRGRRRRDPLRGRARPRHLGRPAARRRARARSAGAGRSSASPC